MEIEHSKRKNFNIPVRPARYVMGAIASVAMADAQGPAPQAGAPFDLDQLMSRMAADAQAGRGAYLEFRFEGGPWDGQTRDQPRVFRVGEHCMPHDDGPSCTWSSHDGFPGQWRYRPVTGPDVEPVVMRWSPPPADGAGET